MASELQDTFEAGDVITLHVEETVAADFLGVLEITLLKSLRYLPRRRSVWMADYQGRKISLKVYVPHRKQERDVGREWNHAVALQEAGMDVPAPLFFARGAEGALAVGFDFVENGETVDRVLARGSRELRQQIFSQLVGLHLRLHDAGWYQSDNHLGNYLWSGEKLWILDAGSFVARDTPLALSERLDNISELAANIPLRQMPDFKKMVVLEYGDLEPGFDEAYKSALLARRQKYYKKTKRACSEFECHRMQGRHWLACRDISQSLKEKLLSDPDQFFEGRPLVKNGNTCSVVGVTDAGREYILKRYNQKPLFYRLTHLFLTPRALRSWSNGLVLRLFGVSTPRPVACLLHKSGPILNRGFLLIEKAAGVPLWDEDPSKMSDATQEIPSQFAKLWGCLDTIDATHGDMKASNFMVDENGFISLIDLDSLVFHRSVRLKRRRQLKDLRRFMRNWDKLPVVKAAFEAALKATLS